MRPKSLSNGNNPWIAQKFHHSGDGIVSDVKSGETHAVLGLEVNCVDHGAIEVKSACIVTAVVVGLGATI